MSDKLKVVFIEDEDIYIDTYNELLHEIERIKNFHFDQPGEYRDKKSALNVIDGWGTNPETTPDLVFLDLILPITPEIFQEKNERKKQNQSSSIPEDSMDTRAGIELYNGIRAKEQLTQLPIIIL